MVVPLFVGREKSIRALDYAMARDKEIILCAQKKAKTNEPVAEDIFGMGTLGTIASGAMQNLIHRAASVAIKEERRLVLMPRETPLSAIHLRNMLTLREAGATILFLAPGFYHGAESVDDLVDFVVDRNVHKHGRCMPGTHQPILAPDALLAAQPDYVLLLAWNFRTEVIAQQAEYVRRGGRFIVPVPWPELSSRNPVRASTKSTLRTPSCAISSRTSSATKKK